MDLADRRVFDRKARDFLSHANFANILGSQATLVMLTIGMIIPMTVGEFDVSMAGLVSACLMFIGVLNVKYAWPIGRLS